jgi:hypothetical protein
VLWLRCADGPIRWQKPSRTDNYSAAAPALHPAFGIMQKLVRTIAALGIGGAAGYAIGKRRLRQLFARRKTVDVHESFTLEADVDGAKVAEALPLAWDAEIVAGDRDVAWRTFEGAPLAHHGTLHLEPTPDGKTRVDLHMTYECPDGVIARAVARIVGADPRSGIKTIV